MKLHNWGNTNIGEEEAEEEEEDEATEAENSKMEPVVRAPQMSHILEKFRHRSDKMNVRETFPLLDKVIERFSNGRKGGLISDSIFTLVPPSKNVWNPNPLNSNLWPVLI